MRRVYFHANFHSGFVSQGSVSDPIEYIYKEKKTNSWSALKSEDPSAPQYKYLVPEQWLFVHKTCMNPTQIKFVSNFFRHALSPSLPMPTIFGFFWRQQFLRYSIRISTENVSVCYLSADSENAEGTILINLDFFV